MKIISRTEIRVGGMPRNMPRNYKVTRGLKPSQTAAPTDNTKSSIREEVENANKILAACNRSIAATFATSTIDIRNQHKAVATKGLKKTRRPVVNTRNAPIASRKKPVGSRTMKIVPVKTKNKKHIETREAEKDSEKAAPTDSTKSSIREEVESANKVLAAAVAQSKRRKRSATPSAASSLAPSLTSSLASSLASSLSSSSSCGIDAIIYDIRRWIKTM